MTEKGFKLIPEEIPVAISVVRRPKLTEAIVNEFLAMKEKSCRVVVDGMESFRLYLLLANHIRYRLGLGQRVNVVKRGDRVYLERVDK